MTGRPSKSGKVGQVTVSPSELAGTVREMYLVR